MRTGIFFTGLVTAFAFALACDPGEGLTGQDCEVDEDCDDGIFCNGTEKCGAGACFRFSVDCNDGIECTEDSCDETRRSCRNEAPDADEDGVRDHNCLALDGLPLGYDCDDEDPNRYPGNAEVCDAEHHDEDCDPETFGAEDQDGDGHFDVGCCNVDEDDGTLYCGTDCDDTLATIVPGSQVCDGQTEGGVLICGLAGEWEAAMCDPDNPDAYCQPQPTGEGVCI